MKTYLHLLPKFKMLTAVSSLAHMPSCWGAWLSRGKVVLSSNYNHMFVASCCSNYKSAALDKAGEAYPNAHRIPTQYVGLLWTRDRPVPETSNWQHTTFADKYLCFWRNSNPQSQQASGRRPTPETVRPPGSAENMFALIGQDPFRSH